MNVTRTESNPSTSAPVEYAESPHTAGSAFSGLSLALAKSPDRKNDDAFQERVIREKVGVIVDLSPTSILKKTGMSRLLRAASFGKSLGETKSRFEVACTDRAWTKQSRTHSKTLQFKKRGDTASTGLEVQQLHFKGSNAKPLAGLTAKALVELADQIEKRNLDAAKPVVVLQGDNAVAAEALIAFIGARRLLRAQHSAQVPCSEESIGQHLLDVIDQGRRSFQKVLMQNDTGAFELVVEALRQSLMSKEAAPLSRLVAKPAASPADTTVKTIDSLFHSTRDPVDSFDGPMPSGESESPQDSIEFPALDSLLRELGPRQAVVARPVISLQSPPAEHIINLLPIDSPPASPRSMAELESGSSARTAKSMAYPMDPARSDTETSPANSGSIEAPGHSESDVIPVAAHVKVSQSPADAGFAQRLPQKDHAVAARTISTSRMDSGPVSASTAAVQNMWSRLYERFSSRPAEPVLDASIVHSEFADIKCPEATAVTVPVLKKGVLRRRHLHANRIDYSAIQTTAVTPLAPSTPARSVVAGQSPQDFSRAEGFILEGIESGNGTFQFVSSSTHNRVRHQGVEVALIDQLLNQWKARGELVLGGRYEVNSVTQVLDESGNVDACRIELNVTEKAHPENSKTVVLTHAGLTLRDRYLRADQIRRADTLIESHIKDTKRLAAAGATVSAPAFVSQAGVGRNATLICYREVMARLDQIENVSALDDLLEEVIAQGREDRGEHFMPSVVQLGELRAMLAEAVVEHQRSKQGVKTQGLANGTKPGNARASEFEIQPVDREAARPDGLEANASDADQTYSIAFPSEWLG